MNLTIASIRCALQNALLGAITPIVRLVSAKITDNQIDIFFYYDQPPSDDEEDLSEIVSTEVMCSFQDMPSTNVHRFVLPYPKMLPKDEDKIPVYYRWEKTPPEF